MPRLELGLWRRATGARTNGQGKAGDAKAFRGAGLPPEMGWSGKSQSGVPAGLTRVGTGGDGLRRGAVPGRPGQVGPEAGRGLLRARGACGASQPRERLAGRL